jgi:hypothetical protein
LGFSSSPPQPATRDSSLSFKKTKPGQPPPRWKIFSSSCQPRAWLFGDGTQSSPSQHLSLLLLFPSTRQPTRRQSSFPASSPKHSRPSLHLTSPHLTRPFSHRN